MRGNVFSPEYLISNGIALFLLLLAIWRPVTTRMLLSLLFIGAAFFNGIMAVLHPEWYRSYADIAAIPLYEKIINGAFSEHIVIYIIAIAICQILIGVFIGFKGRMQKIALAGAIVFLLAIAPLGAGSAFPSSILMAIACLILLFKHKEVSFPELFIKHDHPLA